jgi:predicted PurR-regulated permease PerM
MAETPQPGEQRIGVAAWTSFLVALGAVLALVARILVPFFSVILFALVTGGLLDRPFGRLVRWFGGRRVPAAALVSVLLVVAVVMPLVWTAVAVSNEAVTFYQITVAQLDQVQLLELLQERQEVFDEINRVMAPFGTSVTAESAYHWFTAQGVRLGAFFYSRGLALARGLARLLFGFFLWILLVFFLLVDGDRLWNWIVASVPLPAGQLAFLCRRFNDMAGSLVLGNGLNGVFQGLAGAVVFALLGLPAPVMWGVVMAVLAFIPAIGMSFVFIPGAVILLLAGEPARAALMVVPLMVVATVGDFWLKPILVGKRAHMHPLLVILALVGGLDALGPVGLLVGPLTMMVFLALVELFRDVYRPASGIAAEGVVAPPGD